MEITHVLRTVFLSKETDNALKRRAYKEKKSIQEVMLDILKNEIPKYLVKELK